MLSRLPGLLSLVGALSLSAPADAQLEARSDMRFHFIARASVEGALTGLTESLQLEVSVLDLEYTQPLRLGPSRQLHNRFTFRKENVEAETDTPLTLFEPVIQTAGQRELAMRSENFLRLGYDAELVQRLSPHWSATMMGGTMLSVNDEQEAGFGDLALRGGAQIDYTTGSGWVVGAGVLYSQLTGVSALFPILHLESPVARGGWRLSVLTPRALWYRPHNTAV